MVMRIRAVLVASLLSSTLVACGGADQPGDAAAGDSARSGASPTPGSTDTTGGDRAGANGWVLTATSFGPIRFGMTLAEARAALPEGAWTQPKDTLFCDYPGVKGAPDGTAFMTEGGRVMRGEIRAGAIATAEGAKIGDSEERIRSLYAGRLKEMPHKYTDGKYLVVTPNPADTLARIIFETDGTKVTRLQGGLMPNVEYVEGCS